jgi:hypothetical protein
MVDTSKYLKECNDITTVDLDRERRAALILSRRSILCDTSRGVIVLPLIVPMRATSCGDALSMVDDLEYLEACKGDTTVDIDRQQPAVTMLS